jgi:pimeloyl-ACP methyl ester carboxylesterase
LGWSEPSPEPISSREVAVQLHSLLAEADITGPYILVEHSIGGLHVRNFAQLYPAEVSGIVLVDSSHENQNLRLPPGFALQRNSPSGLSCWVLAPLGVFRIFKVYEQQLASSLLSPAENQKVVANRNQTHFCRAQINEEIAAEMDLSQPTPPSSLGDLPLIVLSAGIGLSGTDPTTFPFPVTYEDLINADRVHLALQRELAALSTNSTQIVADESGHNIHQDQPDLVIGAVLQMVAMYSPGTPPNPAGQISGDLR